jgi:hypothetical protein
VNVSEDAGGVENPTSQAAPIEVTITAGDMIAPPFLSLLERYVTELKSVPDFFERKVEPSRLRRLKLEDALIGGPPYLRQLSGYYQYRVILDHLYYYRKPNGSIQGPSVHFTTTLRALCENKKLSTIRQWFHTANGVVLSYLLVESNPNYLVVDKLTHCVLENCASNYSHFLSIYKKWKKTLRKWYAEGEEGEPPLNRALGCIPALLLPYIRRRDGTPQQRYQRVLVITQTRNVGLADRTMAELSLAKFVTTVTTPAEEIKLDYDLLKPTVGFCLNVSGAYAKVSCGPTACLESTRQTMGQTGLLMYLANQPVLEYRYDFETLEPTLIVREQHPVILDEGVNSSGFNTWWYRHINMSTSTYYRDLRYFREQLPVRLNVYRGVKVPPSLYWQSLAGPEVLPDPQPVRSAEDLLNWAVQTALHRPIHVRSVRAHVVCEPAKARVITVASYAYMVIMYVFGHLWQKLIKTSNVRSGLVGSRHLWSFLKEDLHPQNPIGDPS